MLILAGKSTVCNGMLSFVNHVKILTTLTIIFASDYNEDAKTSYQFSVHHTNMLFKAASLKEEVVSWMV
jgi:hypothetical protein